ncbi:MAG: nucleotide exchange factor GrpE [Dehalococcoidales bacterium]|nr:nucleotide exchange factor GrpE [Dehalococcoidales bacterium]
MMPHSEPEKNEEQTEAVTPETPETAAPEVPEGEVVTAEGLAESLTAEKNKAEEYLAGWQRAQADFINYKRRCEQEKEELIKYGEAEFITKILPVLDDFELAFSHIPRDAAKAEWVKGIKALERKLKTFLEGEGVTEIKALGKSFDPNLHEAMMQAPGKEGIVIQEYLKGYILNDRVIRHSKVVVGDGQHEGKKEE